MNILNNYLNANDISFLEFLPQDVIYVKNKNQIKKAILEANKKGFSIHARGWATSVGGHSLGNGIILNFSKYFNKILKITSDYIDVEPGLTAGEINKNLIDTFFPVDPSSLEFASIGGMVANNSSGLHSLKYGVTSDYVIGLEGFFSDGSFFSTIENINTQTIIESINILEPEFLKLKKFLPKTIRNTAGYNIVFNENKINLNKLLTASEGTLTIFTKIRLKIIKKYKTRDTLLLLFNSIDDALKFIPRYLNSKISSLELLDTEIITLSLLHYPETASYFDSSSKAGLIIEIDDDPIFTDNFIKTSFDIPLKIRVAKNKIEAEKIVWLRKASSPILNRIVSNKRSIRIIEDIVVPMDKIYDFYFKEKKILGKYFLNTAFFGHLGVGHFHINPIIDTGTINYLDLIYKLADESFNLAKGLNGSMAGEHGDGIIRTQFIKELYPELYEFYLKIKNIFDPKNILNPNKIVNPLKINISNSKYAFKPVLKISNDLINLIQHCDGCNYCLNFCESFKKYKEEKYKTRGRASIMRGIVRGYLDNSSIKFLDKCKNCGNCKDKCPAGVDMPELIKKFKNELFGG